MPVKARNMEIGRMGRAACVVGAFFVAAAGLGDLSAQEKKVDLSTVDVHRVRWSAGSDKSGFECGTVVVNPKGERRVIVSGRHRPEIWKIASDGAVLDTGYFVSTGVPGRIGVEWEMSERVVWEEPTLGVLPWSAKNERVDAFRLSDWLVARQEAVGLPYFGRESVEFTFRPAGVLSTVLKNGEKAGGAVVVVPRHAAFGDRRPRRRRDL